MAGSGTQSTTVNATGQTDETYVLRVTVQSTGPSDGIPLFVESGGQLFETRREALARAEAVRSNPEELRRFGVDPESEGSVTVRVVETTPVAAADIARLRQRRETERREGQEVPTSVTAGDDGGRRGGAGV